LNFRVYQAEKLSMKEIRRFVAASEGLQFQGLSKFMILDKFTYGAGRGGEPKPVFEIRKLLIRQSTESLKSLEPTSIGTIRAQEAS